MRGELVALDLETTGLDPNHDAIIEFGAVRIKDGSIVEEYTTYVNPDRPIPSQITHLTGITNENVAGFPTIQAVLPKIQQFVGGVPIIAHNISLDMGFLQQKHGILKENVTIDTYDLASVLMPAAPRYNLNSLTAQLGINLEHAHRALDDARATAQLYWHLWQKILSIPQSLLSEVIYASQDINWGTNIVFKQALSSSEMQDKVYQQQAVTFLPLDEAAIQPLYAHPERKPLDIRNVVSHLQTGSPLAQTTSNFEERSQQLEMAKAVTNALNQSHHLMVEAGTGTGKSLAYLIPAILWATRNNERVVISTNTINLQDQLLHKDIPALQEALNTDFTASVMKGRSNYLCPRRLEAVRRRRPTSDVELRTLAKILVWLLDSKTGDRGEINLRGPAENTVWQRLSAQDEDCAPTRCEVEMHGVCPFYKARKVAESSHILIVNHALLVSDSQTENRVLPPYRYAIIDEAHHLEDAITQSQTIHIDRQTIVRRLADIGSPNRGFLGDVLKNTRELVPDKEFMKLERFAQVIGEATSLMDTHVQHFFAVIRAVLEDGQNISPSDYLTLHRIQRDHRNKAGFAEIQARWRTLDEFFEVVSDAMLRLTRALNRMEQFQVSQLADLITGAETAGSYLLELRTQLNSFVLEPDENSVYWVTIMQGVEDPVLHVAPIHIGHIIEKQVWQTKEAVILTSATLRTQDNFEYIKERLFADSIQTVEIGSPFNYRQSVLLYVPNDIPEPTDRQGYQRAVERGIIELAAALEGRVLVLFTSYTQLRQTAQAIAPRLALGNITVYDQSDGSSRESLLEGFKSTEKAVLLGTKSFWEGIDIPGDSLSALIITRLPFAVPTDPVFAARSETYSNGFNQYALPDAILRFRQGFGRLIRTTTDRGVVAIFDRRVLTKGYGSNFLEALPDCTMRDGSLDNLPEIAKNWINTNT